MKLFSHVLLDPGAEGSGGGGEAAKGGLGGGGAPADWRTALPEDIRADPSLTSIKDVASLAKSYVHAQKLVGTDKIAKPSDKWDEKQWGEFYDAAGRPKDFKAYGFPKDFKMPDGVELDAKTFDGAKEVFHKAGLSAKQAEAVLGYYGQLVAQGHTVKQTDHVKAQETLMADLHKEWGTTTEHRIAMANQVAMQFGGAEFMDAIESAGLHLHPAVIKTFAKLAENLSEDSLGGTSGGLQVPIGMGAQQEINQLLQDPKFTDAWLNPNNPGHKVAVDRMMTLQKNAAR